MSLFANVSFRSHSGLDLSWKLECDALTPDDWAWAAARVAERYSFTDVMGVPEGGLPFERALKPHRKSGGEYFLVVDDVLTTGSSILSAMAGMPNALGIVLFARRQEPVGVKAPFTYWP